MELRPERMARELVNKIQNMGKDADFNLSDRVRLSFFASELIAAAFERHRGYILTETLIKEVFQTLGENAFSLEQKLNGELAIISVEQV